MNKEPKDRIHIAYASRTGHVEKIVRILGLADCVKIETGTETVDAPYVLFTYTTGKGKTPKAVEAFLAANPGVAAVVGSGSTAKSHIETFNFAAENVSRAYHVPAYPESGRQELLEQIMNEVLFI